MSARLIARYADDPRVVTFSVLVLIGMALWLATWQTMGGMMNMQMDMKMSGSKMAGKTMSMGQSGASAMQDGSMQAGTMENGSTENVSKPGAPMHGEAMQNEAMTRMGSGTGMASMSGASGMAEMPGMAGMAGGMDMPGMSMDPTDWSAGTIAVTIAMWIMMMAAMMIPAMAPICAIYAGLACKEDTGARLALRIGLFTLGYFLIWIGFSVVAALGQLALRDSAFFAMGGTLALPTAAGILLLIAGLYEFTPVKEFCLRHCRHPLTYLMGHWREGVKGAFPVGFNHGIYCLGCCITLMGLMFVFGAMNIVWMAVIALYLLAEKILPRAEIWGRAAGALMIVAGAVTLIREVA